VPAAGASLAVGSKVTLNVSKGPDLVAVPDVSGLAEQDAAARFVAAGLTEGNRYGPPNKKVFATNPTAGTKVKRGSAIDIYTR
jgi:serine/threonine-protein kinase